MQPVKVSFYRPIIEKRDVMAPWYVYNTNHWVVVNTVKANGSGDIAPAWPKMDIPDGHREGSRSEDYSADISLDDGTLHSILISAQEYARYTPGSPLTVSRNIFGMVIATTLPADTD